MTYTTYDDLHRDVIARYRTGDFAAAYDLLTQAEADLPDDAANILYMRSCMAARIDQPDLALDILEHALGRNFWYGEDMMRQSPSWQGLQGNPRFEELARTSIERHRAAHATARARLLIGAPQGGCTIDQPCPTLLALHGNTHNGAESQRGWQPLVDAGWLLAAIQSSQIAGYEAFVWNDAAVALRDVRQQYALLREQYAIDEARLLIAGFSLGGAVALHTALTGAVPVRGFVLLGPALEPAAVQTWLEQYHPTPYSLRGYVLLGADDQAVDRAAIQQSVTLLNGNGIACELEIIADLSHEYPRDAGATLRRAVAWALADRTGRTGQQAR